MLSARASDAPSLAHELFVPEVFTRDNLPEHLTNSELQRSISHLGDLERLHCFLEKVRAGRNVSVGVVGGSVSEGRRPVCLMQLLHVLCLSGQLLHRRNSWSSKKHTLMFSDAHIDLQNNTH